MAFPELTWLPIRDSFSEELHALGTSADQSAWDRLCRLANSRIDHIATLQLDRRLVRLFGEAPPPDLSTKPVKLAVLASSTVDHLLPAIRVGALRRGLWTKIHVGPYGQYLQELHDPASGLHQFRPDCVLFALDAHHLLAGFTAAMPAEDVDRRLAALAADLAAHWRYVRGTLKAKVVQQTLLPVHEALFGNNEHRLAGSRARLVERVNEVVRTRADAEGVDCLSLDRRAARDGLSSWYDPMLWHRAKQEVHPAAGPVYGDLVARIMAAQQGLSSKCLVLDLDNTLWGGVIGDDGLSGIVLGQGSALGEAFVAFQDYARSLSARGIILAINSKNDEANAVEPFEKHPDMVLKRSDIAAFVANWSDKSANLIEIARRLNIGVDTLVFVDDNPFERNFVRQALPAVAVPELPPDPALYPGIIADAGYFEGVQLTDEDFERTELYQANERRDSLMSSSRSLTEYLGSLDMEMRWSRFNGIGKSRVVQLINKTNQFNLTTRRHTDESVSELMADPRALTLQLRLIDQFGDNGIIGIVIGRFEDGAGDMLLDTWLMSCRVLGRQVEEATLNLVVEEASRLGARRLIGEYRPTAKNGMVREHYAKLGFAAHSEHEGGRTRWALDISRYKPTPTFIRITEAP
jgi:FkbH-like protein